MLFKLICVLAQGWVRTWTVWMVFICELFLRKTCIMTCALYRDEDWNILFWSVEKVFGWENGIQKTQKKIKYNSWQIVHLLNFNKAFSLYCDTIQNCTFQWHCIIFCQNKIVTKLVIRFYFAFQKFWQLAKHISDFVTWQQVEVSFSSFSCIINVLKHNCWLNQLTMVSDSQTNHTYTHTHTI